MDTDHYYQRTASRQAAIAVGTTTVTITLAVAVAVLALNGQPAVAAVITAAAAGTAYAARRAISVAVDTVNRRPRIDHNAPDPERHAEFMRIVDTVRGWDIYDRERYEAVADKHWTGAQEESRTRAYAIAVSTGRIDPADDTVNSGAYLLDILCGIVGGTSGVAVAVLVADLLHPTDYRTLTEWWAAAGLPLPAPDGTRRLIH